MVDFSRGDSRHGDGVCGELLRWLYRGIGNDGLRGFTRGRGYRVVNALGGWLWEYLVGVFDLSRLDVLGLRRGIYGGGRFSELGYLSFLGVGGVGFGYPGHRGCVLPFGRICLPSGVGSSGHGRVVVYDVLSGVVEEFIEFSGVPVGYIPTCCGWDGEYLHVGLSWQGYSGFGFGGVSVSGRVGYLGRVKLGYLQADVSAVSEVEEVVSVGGNDVQYLVISPTNRDEGVFGHYVDVVCQGGLDSSDVVKVIRYLGSNYSVIDGNVSLSAGSGFCTGAITTGEGLVYLVGVKFWKDPKRSFVAVVNPGSGDVVYEEEYSALIGSNDLLLNGLSCSGDFIFSLDRDAGSSPSSLYCWDRRDLIGGSYVSPKIFGVSSSLAVRLGGMAYPVDLCWDGVANLFVTFRVEHGGVVYGDIQRVRCGYDFSSGVGELSVINSGSVVRFDELRGMVLSPMVGPEGLVYIVPVSGNRVDIYRDAGVLFAL